jgi:thymidine kinase
MGILYIVPTPVGNMEDMTMRAIRVLKEADMVLAEDTRTSSVLLKHFDIKNRLVVCGSMFSGKTEELIRRMKRASFARQKVEIFKPAIDTRYSEDNVVSHDQNSIRSTPIESSGSILLLASDIDVVGIDEAQFLDNGLVEVCNELANRGVRVIVAGLDMDFKGVPFGPIPALCAIADEVTKVHAICVKCGALAYVSHRLVANDKRVLLGEQDEYEPLCRDCYQKAISQEK